MGHVGSHLSRFSQAPLKFALLISSSVLLASPAVLAQEPPYVHRGIFFGKEPLGALAWIDASTKGSALGKQMVYVLSPSRCQSLPTRSVYWFLINHRNPTEEGTEGFFAVRIIGEKSTATDRGSGAVRVYRNSGWFTDEGKSLGPGPSETNLPIGITEFVRLHDDTTADNRDKSPNQRLIELTGRVGVWHARPSLTLPNSWVNRSIFANWRHLDDPGVLLLAARLMRFSATGGTVSEYPAVFYVNNQDFDTLRISISAPNFGINDLETRIVIGRPCD